MLIPIKECEYRERMQEDKGNDLSPYQAQVEARITALAKELNLPIDVARMSVEWSLRHGHTKLENIEKPTIGH